MIRHLGLTNFKCFPQAEVELGNLNVFAGANGTGKSTFVQALLLLFQSLQSGHLQRGRLQLNGRHVDLGTGRDVLFKRSDADEFRIFLRDEAEGRTVIAAATAERVLDTVVDPGDATLRCLGDRLLYLSADRLGPQKSYPMSMDDVSGNDLGRRGEYAPLLFNRSRSITVKNEQILLENSNKEKFPDLESQFTLWMCRLFPGFQLRTDNHDPSDSTVLGMNMQRQIGEPEFLRPSNVGFGVSIVLPVILGGLLAEPKTTYVVENPEAHLHPSGQSLVGEFLARVAAGGAQVFVETHSDHVVNGMRIALRNEVLSTADLRFFAFSKTEEYGGHRVARVQIDANGEFKGRPDSFFDQADKDLKIIYGLE